MITKSETTGKLLSPATIKIEVVLAKRFLKHSGRDTSSLEKDKLKLPRAEETITVADLYSKDELAAILNACIHTRDRAMLEVLYESAARASELLSMTFKNMTFNEDGTATIIISGKTGTRPVPLYQSVPALKAWLEVHPIGKGPIWTRLRRPHKPLTSRQSYGVLQQALDRAGVVGKKRIVHMMRHTRATELVRLGIRGQVLSKFMGWTKKSNMEAIYVHLSTEDVTNELHAKVFGFATRKETRKPLLESM
ncbi:MAG: tyrosine-type recombinase/integrase, partial [Candidatus Thorarchaeota archaeon]|nr:tyrosine-type recombinase/integrase [Candidatus Thorarchaeota archaeon]